MADHTHNIGTFAEQVVKIFQTQSGLNQKIVLYMALQTAFDFVVLVVVSILLWRVTH